MKIDFDNLERNNIELLGCQCEVVLKCLEYYCYSANFLFERNKKYTSREDELKISFITDTYHQISQQLGQTKSERKNSKLKKVS